MRDLSYSDVIKRIKSSIVTVHNQNSFQEGSDPISFEEFDTEKECFDYYYDLYDWLIDLYRENPKQILMPSIDKNKVILEEGGDHEFDITFQSSKLAKKFYGGIMEKIK